MTVTIPDEIYTATHLSENEFKQEISIMLYQKGKLSIGQASKLAAISRIQFQHLLGSRDICINYGIDDFNQDIETLKKVGRL